MPAEFRLQMILQIARLYYEKGETQQEIATKLNISRPQVSRYLQQAREMGVVQIRIVDPREVCEELGRELKERFGLRDVLVLPLATTEPEELAQELGKAAARYLEDIVEAGDIIGIAWGNTLHQVARALSGNKQPPDIKVVQLKGGVTRTSTEFPTGELAVTFARAFNGTAYLLPAPTFVEDEAARDVLIREPSIQNILRLGRQANIALVSIGYPSRNSVLVKAGFFTAGDIENMRANGAVGDICSRFFRRDGSLYSTNLDRRTIGISLEEIKEKPYSIGVAGGLNRVEGILGALRGGYINVLITDEITAKGVLEVVKGI